MEGAMLGTPRRITAAELRERYQAGGEIAIADAREEGSFHERHLLMASCLPLSRLELMAPGLLPRRSAPVVVCDDGEGLAERTAVRLIEGGYTDISVLAGGIAAWLPWHPVQAGAPRSPFTSSALPWTLSLYCATWLVGSGVPSARRKPSMRFASE